jgi:class 3 adenylate cyclase
MEPQIQYATTADGVSIAYAVFGDGPPIVFASFGFGTLHLYSSDLPPGAPQSVDMLVSLGRRVIIYDGRGMGSSERGNTDFSLEGRLRDLEAVIGQATVDNIALYGTISGGPLAIAYAVRYPDRVSRLVLVDTYANGADYYTLVPAARATRATGTMAEEQWEYYTLARANALTGFTDSQLAQRLAEVFRLGMSARAYTLHVTANEKIDVTDLLPMVKVPTLVVHRPSNPLSNLDLARALASRIPNARLITTDVDIPAVDAFLREGKEHAAPPTPTHPEPIEGPSGTAVILFADIADSTALTERLGDAGFRAKARELDGALRALIRECGGTPVEGPTLGDGVLAVFTSAREAIEAAVRCANAGASAGMPLHVGIHAGDVMREKDPDGRANVYGGAVNIAARIAGASAPGEILVSDIVRGIARTSTDVTFEDRGEHELKGISDAQRLFAVRTREGDA